VRPLVQEVPTQHSPESLAGQLHDQLGVVLLRSAWFDSPQARYSFVTARPFLTFRSFGSRCELSSADGRQIQFGNPWHLLDSLMARYELLEELDRPFPLGGCFGYWGYDLKNFVEPRLVRRAIDDLELPECHVGFYDSLVVFDHRLEKTWVVSTGLQGDGSRNAALARRQLGFWQERLANPAMVPEPRVRVTGHENFAARVPVPPLLGERAGVRAEPPGVPISETEADVPALDRFTTGLAKSTADQSGLEGAKPQEEWKQPLEQKPQSLTSNLSRAAFIGLVERAQRYIRAGDIYQVNLAQRLAAPCDLDGWELFQRLADVSPAPFAAYLDCGEFQIASSSPELFLRLSGAQIQTRPIKGTRPRSREATRDAQLAYELQTSPKEMAELVMITDLLRNDLGRVCQYGSVQVPELARLERFPQVQHLVSTVEGRLRPDVTHFSAFAKCFPGGSVTGAPKIRAMEIIEELEPVTRGPYTGCAGYLGFNRESQVSILIRTAVCRPGRAWFSTGAGIVADSHPEAEYEETLAKAGGFLSALQLPAPSEITRPAIESGG